MFIDTAFLAGFIPMFHVPPVEAYRDAALKRIVPAFDSLELDADSFAEEEFARLCQTTAIDDRFDLGDLAEIATRRGNEYAETMFAMRQTVLNLLAAGLHHLFEQQQKSLWYQTYAGRTGKNFHWKALERNLLVAGVDPAALPCATRLDELRHAANTIKHGAGRSAACLAASRPDLFVFGPDREQGIASKNQQRAAAREAANLHFAPLGGGDLYVTEADLADWCDAVLEHWRGISAAFREHQLAKSNSPFDA